MGFRDINRVPICLIDVSVLIWHTVMFFEVLFAMMLGGIMSVVEMQGLKVLQKNEAAWNREQITFQSCGN